MNMPKIQMTESELHRKAAYRIDPLMAAQVEVIERYGRLDGEHYGSSLWKNRINTAAVIMAMTASMFVATAPGQAEAYGRCPQYEAALAQYAPRGGWNVTRMSQLAWRESRCTPNVRSKSRDTGLLQINDVNLSYLTQKLGFPVTVAALKDPITNIRAAAKLCEFARRAWGSCYFPWRKS